MSYEALVNLFEHIHFFLQRLNRCPAILLAPELTELLAKVMAQILSILALSTKTIKERRILRQGRETWKLRTVSMIRLR